MPAAFQVNEQLWCGAGQQRSSAWHWGEACTAVSSRGTDACLREHLFKRLDEALIFASDCSFDVPQDIFIPSSSVIFLLQSEIVL